MVIHGIILKNIIFFLRDRKRACMNITFLIGNGFDVGVGMESRFSDFFPKYCADSVNKSESLIGLSKDIEEHQDDWSYFERQIGKYTEKFTAETKQNFLAQFRDFEVSFIAYLKNQEESLRFDSPQKIAEIMRKGLAEFYSSANLPIASSQQIAAVYNNHAAEEHKYNFITFNYTSILEKCLKTIPNSIVKTRKVSNIEKQDTVGKVVHVHGYIDTYPIMGVNDVSQIANKELATNKRFARYIVKPISNDAHRMNHDKESTALINSSHIICIYGMSLGETDKDWWNKILTWLSKDGNRQLVIFVYDKQFSMSTQFDWIEKEDSIIDTLAQYPTNKNFNVEDLRPRIHIAVHKNIFEMNLSQDPFKALNLTFAKA